MCSDYNAILCVSDVCEIMLIGRNQVYELLSTGSLKGFRVGKILKIPRNIRSVYPATVQSSVLIKSGISCGIQDVFFELKYLQV